MHLRAKLRLILGPGTTNFERLHRAFPDPRYIFLTRRDKVLQAVSYARARQTNRWHSLAPDEQQNPETPLPTPTFDVDEINRWVSRFTDDEMHWRRFFERAGVEPFEVVYEEFAESYESTVLAMLRHLDIALPEGTTVTPPRLRKLGDELSAEWCKAYRTWKWRHTRCAGRPGCRTSSVPRPGLAASCWPKGWNQRSS